MDRKLEAVVGPVADVARAKAISGERAGGVVNLDARISDAARIAQPTWRRPAGDSGTILGLFSPYFRSRMEIVSGSERTRASPRQGTGLTSRQFVVVYV